MSNLFGLKNRGEMNKELEKGGFEMNNVFEICKIIIAGQLVVDYLNLKEIPKDKIELARKRIRELDLLDKEYKNYLKEKGL